MTTIRLFTQDAGGGATARLRANHTVQIIDGKLVYRTHFHAAPLVLDGADLFSAVKQIRDYVNESQRAIVTAGDMQAAADKVWGRARPAEVRTVAEIQAAADKLWGRAPTNRRM